MSTTHTDELITAQQYADEMGVTLRHVYQMRYLGIGPVSYKRSGRIVFQRSDIDTYLERQRVRTLRGEGVVNETPCKCERLIFPGERRVHTPGESAP